MAKRTITKWWIVGAVIMVAGGILSLASSLALAAHIQNVTAGNRYPFNPTPNDNVFWTILFFLILGGIIAGGGAIAQLVAWIGAVFNTYRLADKKWFHILLWGGLAGYLVILATLGIFWPTDVVGGLITWGVMLPYLVAGPDGMAIQQPQIERPTEPTVPPKTLVPTG
jgi:hypothetical protein